MPLHKNHIETDKITRNNFVLNKTVPNLFNSYTLVGC